MINILEQMAETHTVCAKIGMCYPDQFGLVDMTDDIASDDEIDSADATSTTKPKLVGANPCLWGPSYWCANKQNAEDCKVSIYFVKNAYNLYHINFHIIIISFRPFHSVQKRN